MLEMWNARYAEPEYAYGKQPNRFFKEQLSNLMSPPGRVLMPAEGEGRNAVYAAMLGWEVTAFDISEEGRKKTMKLANEKNVSIDYHIGPYEEGLYSDESFDALGLIFAHFPAHLRQSYHVGLLKLLKPGGIVIFEAFAKSHLSYSSKNSKAGGPKTLDMLFSVNEVKREFEGVDFLEIHEQEVQLEEGKYHLGKAAVIRFLARKS